MQVTWDLLNEVLKEQGISRENRQSIKQKVEDKTTDQIIESYQSDRHNAEKSRLQKAEMLARELGYKEANN